MIINLCDTFVGLLYQISAIISEGYPYDPLHFYSSQRKLFSSWEHCFIVNFFP